MNDLTFAATLLSVSALLVVAVLLEATGAPRHATARPVAVASGPAHMASVRPAKDCVLVASTTAVR
jgi:hypothetical protein